MLHLIKKHQLVAYFLITFIISWGLMLPAMIGPMNDLTSILGLIGIFVPALVTVLLSRWVSPPPTQKTRRKWITFLLVWVLATISFTLNANLSSPIESPFVIVFFALFGFLPAGIWSSAFSKFPLVRENLSSLVRPRGRLVFYLVALLLAPLVKLISAPINAYLGLASFSTPQVFPDFEGLASFTLISFFYTFFFAGGVNEEVGWSGFALPKLQQKFSPLIASMVLWFFWLLWHLPLQRAGLWNPDPVDFIRALIGSFFARFIFTWLFNKTKGSILSAMIFHTAANVSFMVLPSNLTHMVIEAGLSIILIVTAKMWRRLPEAEPVPIEPVLPAN